MRRLNSKFRAPSFVCLVLIGVLAIVLSFQWGSQDREGYNRNIISSDGLGYYDYLPSLFLTDDFATKNGGESFIVSLNEDQAFNKYFSGTALMMSPFFMIGHFSAKIFNYKQDGYSPPYQNSIALASFIYLLFGLYFISRLLKTYGFSELTICVILPILLFGTNLLYYSIFNPSMSHVYSFFAISIWLYLVRKYWLSEKNKLTNFIAISLVLAIITLIRPTNIIVIFLFPFLSTSLYQWEKEVKTIFLTKRMPLAILVFSIIVFIQPLLWFIQTGKWFIWSYAGEGFDFSNPQFYNVLFSFRKGWWVYTPLMLFASIGIITWWRKNKFLTIGLTLFLILFIYITSSWWNWYYGSSFGQRPFVDIYGVLSIGLAMLINILKEWKRYILMMLFAILCTLNLTQTYQYLNQILSPEFMTKEKYKYVFLKVDESYRDVLGGSSDIEPYKTKLRSLVHEKRFNIDCSTIEFCGEAITKNISDINNGLWIEVNLIWKALDPYAAKDVLLVIDISDKKDTPFYFTTKISPIPKDQINVKEKETYSFHFKDYQCSEGEISIYLWNKNKTSLIVDTLDAKVSELEYN